MLLDRHLGDACIPCCVACVARMCCYEKLYCRSGCVDEQLDCSEGCMLYVMGGFRFWGLGTPGVLDRPCRRRLTLREVKKWKVV